MEKGFDAIGFSGHAPVPCKTNWTMTKEGLSKYIQVLRKLKKIYSERIEIKIGLEIDYITNLAGPADPFYRKIGLDFIIGSVHLFPLGKTGEYISIASNKKNIEQLINVTFKGDARLLVKKYYKNIREMSDLGGFDIIGHLDIVKKINIDSVYFDETEECYRSEIDKTLKCIAENKQIIEINTGNILKNPSRVYPSPWILKRVKEHNIPIVLNSDAHRPDRIDNYFGEAKTILKTAGHTEVRVFIGNKWTNDKIN